MERTCPNCGTVVLDDLARECFNCSAELPPIEEIAPAEEVEEIELEMLPEGEMYCPECTTRVKEGTRECPNCGTGLEHTVRCPSCSIGVDVIAEICPHCFSILGGAEAAVPEAVIPVSPPEEVPIEEPVEEVVEEHAEPTPAKEERRVEETEKEPEEALEEPEEGKEKPLLRGLKRRRAEEEPEEALEEPEEGKEKPLLRGLKRRRAEEEPEEEIEERKLRREERRRKIKEIMKEEGEGWVNYYNLCLITLALTTFMAAFAAAEFFLYATNMTHSAPGVLLEFAPMIAQEFPIAVLVFVVLLTAIDAVLHYFDRKLYLISSFVPTGLMLLGTAVTITYNINDINVDVGLFMAVFVLYLIILMLDIISIAKYPAVLEDPGRTQLEIYLEKEEEMESLRTEMQAETERLLAEEEEKLRMKEEEIRDIEQRIGELNDHISKEEELIRMKEEEISNIQAELNLRNQQLMEEEEKLRMKEEEMESLIKSEVDRRTEDYIMEEEEKIRMKEDELIKTRNDLEIQRTLFDESREKLRLKEQELSHLRTELENQIRMRLEEEERLKLKEAAARMLERGKQKRLLFPFVALVGQEKMKLSLILNAIYPEIGGVLIRGQKGTGKSVSVRGLAEVLPDIDVTGCKYNCDPRDADGMCTECRAKLDAGKIETFTRPVQVVDLPLNITEDRLVGSIDIEKILAEGVKAFEPGILAEAHRGILYVDEINLLDDYIVDILLDAASSGMVIVEREGISLSHPARFIIVGSMNPEEGELRPQILDRIALQTEVRGIQDVAQRMEIVRRREKFTESSEELRGMYEPQRLELRERIIKARELLPNVVTPQHILTLIARICVDFNVDGHRADIIIERGARAHAAFEGRLEVSSDDVVVGAELALPHRMRRRPYEEEEFSEDVLRKLVKRRELEIREGSKE
ncbi:MAG: ATP-binding protein [Candidatus Thermoplasmatota archaeon]